MNNLRCFIPLLLTLWFSLAHGQTTLQDNNVKLSPGDILYIAFPGEAAFNQTFQLDLDGRLLLPEMGELYLSGLALSDVKSLLQQQFQHVFKDTSKLDIYLKERRLLLQVQGYVKQPGLVNLARSDTLQNAINQAGGLLPGAQLDRLQIKRGDNTLTVDYKRYLDSGDASQIPPLQTLDTIFVPASPLIGNVQVEFDAATLLSSGDAAEDKSAVKIFGEVNNPGSFSFRSGASVVDMLMRAGGVTRYASVEQIRVINHSQPTLFNLKQYLDKGDSALLPVLAEGATIFVPKEQEEIKSGALTVYVMGEVFKPGAFESNQQASFLDILANAGGPTRFAESRQIRILRANGQVDKFDLQAFTEGLNSQLPTMRPGDAIFIPEKTDPNEKSWLKVSPNNAVRIMGAVYKPGRYEWSNEMSFLDLLAHAGGPTARADIAHIQLLYTPKHAKATQQIFDLERFLQQGGSYHTLPKIVAGFTVIVPELPQDPSDNKAQWIRQPSDNSIYVFGAVGAPGRYMFNENFNILDILSAANGPTPDADITQLRITHRDKSYANVSHLNLALYFETGDETLLPAIKPGDTLFIPEKNRHWLQQPKEKTIRILGAINKPGRYGFDDSMTILDLLAEAGGPSSNAWLEKIIVVNMSCCQHQARSFDLIAFAKNADFDQLPVVRPGDTILIPDQNQSTWSQVRGALQDALTVLSTVAIVAGL